MNHHDLKTASQFFHMVWQGRKTAEVRHNDRNFQTGDIVRLREWDSTVYSGRTVTAKILSVVLHEEFPEGIKPGYCLISLGDIVRFPSVLFCR
jgi:ASC-1-like (ASCH) protein